MSPRWHLPAALLAALLVPTAAAAQAADNQQATWQLSVRAVAPATTTDPQHLGVTMGLSRAGAYQANVEYQPKPEGRLGMIRAGLGYRLLEHPGWSLSLGIEHTQVRARRRLFAGPGWELDGHDRHQLSLGTATLHWRNTRVLGLLSGIEVGGGRLHIWRLVSARANGGTLNDPPDPILESAVPVGMVGVYARRPLFWGLTGSARARLIGAGHSRGGEVPFAQVTAEWELTRPVFQSPGSRAVLGIVGNHASSIQAASYFQNGVGLTFRMEFR